VERRAAEWPYCEGSERLGDGVRRAMLYECVVRRGGVTIGAGRLRLRRWR
jgi:hypothetical protein